MSILHLFFKFDGRISRFTYIVKGQLILLVLTFLVASLDYFLYGDSSEIGPIFFVWWLVSLWMQWAIAVKRAHDLNHTGWWLLWGMVPIVGQIYIFINLWFIKGSDGANSFGEVTY
jgi:uncharacterized membrane protein YhaH (DUF805 family)